MMKILHIPVLLNEVLENLQLEQGGTVIDCTVGEGGHSVEMLKAIGATGFLYGIDRDKEALSRAKERLLKIGSNFLLINDNFSHIARIKETYDIPLVDGVLADLGLSSLQLHYEDRGFSFLKEGPLDMRMDRSMQLTAMDVVNSFPEKELADIIYKYGEEHFSRRIAKAIVEHRRKKRIITTKELAEIVYHIYPIKRKRIHPATKTFQALRIFVNNEMDNLEKFLQDVPDLLKKGGRIAVISYHSLEDRLVKNAFKNDKRLIRVNKKVIIPEKTEVQLNRRARSAKLRVAERI